jgi:hypothetical protein
MAHQMSALDTHPDFDQLIGIAAERIGILPMLVRKDYWVTRILRAIATDRTLRHQLIFKGGTSLSKGWRLIDRFSEDIDLLTTGKNFSELPGKNERERIFKAIRNRVEHETPLRLPELKELPFDEKSFLYVRSRYHCNIRYPLPGMTIRNGSAFTDFVFLEMGFRGGKHPHLPVSLNSLVGEIILALDEDRRSELALYEADFSPFELELLDPTRTFVEKLLAIHCALARGIENVRTRHYYDLASLFTKSETVRTSLQSKEFADLVKDAVGITIEYFDSGLDPHLNLDVSPALNLAPQQIKILATQYENERQYYFRGQPPFGNLMDTISEIRQVLQKARS